MLPLVSHRAKVFQPVSIARAIWIYGAQIGSNRVSAVRSSFPAFLIFDPLKPPKMPFSDLEGIIFLAYAYSQMNRHVCAKFCPDRTTDSYVNTLGRKHT